MDDPNTLFLLSKVGLKLVDKTGICESRMWLLDEEEESMQYLSLHKSKSDRAYKGGKILSIREATDEEVDEYQDLVEKDRVPRPKNRKIITFQIEKNWHALWPRKVNRKPMAYKGMGFIDKSDSETPES